jgi:hypothetical protein
MGHENLKKPEIAAAVQETLRDRAERLRIQGDRVLQEIAIQAFWDPADFGSQPLNGPADIQKLPEDVRRAIVGWRWDRNGNFILKLADKLAALEKLMKHLGLYQADRIHDADKQTHLLATLLWKFVISLHVGRGVPLPEALRHAEQNPEEVQAWGEAKGLLKSAGEVE